MTDMDDEQLKKLRADDLDGIDPAGPIPTIRQLEADASMSLSMWYERRLMFLSWDEEEMGFDPFTARVRAKKKLAVEMRILPDSVQAAIWRTIQNSE